MGSNTQLTGLCLFVSADVRISWSVYLAELLSLLELQLDTRE